VHVALETCGHFAPALREALIADVDLFLFDIKHADPEQHRRGTGVDNALILANLRALLEAVGAQRLTPRVPLVPGFNADAASLAAILELLGELGYRGEVHLMPHHGWARSKYEGLGRGADYHDAGRLSQREIDHFEALVRARALEPVIHG
jgi:pyruvate formate lyase activating enzyme